MDSSETLVSYHNTIRHHNTQDRDLKYHRLESLKTCNERNEWDMRNSKEHIWKMFLIQTTVHLFSLAFVVFEGAQLNQQSDSLRAERLGFYSRQWQGFLFSPHSENNPASCTVDPWCSFPEGKEIGAWSWSFTSIWCPSLKCFPSRRLYVVVARVTCTDGRGLEAYPVGTGALSLEQVFEGYRFESQPRYRLSWLRLFAVFISLSKECCGHEHELSEAVFMCVTQVGFADTHAGSAPF